MSMWWERSRCFNVQAVVGVDGCTPFGLLADVDVQAALESANLSALTDGYMTFFAWLDFSF